MQTSLLRSLSIFSLGLALLAGCGDGSIPSNKISGKLVTPPGVKLAKNDSVMLTFMPLDGDKGGGSGPVKTDDMTFGPINVAKGKYKVLVQISPYMGEPGSEKRKDAFEALNKSFDMKSTKITCDISADKEQSFVIDMPKGTATKQ